MARPVVIAYHLVWTGYGHWLPNDPRGSGSAEVRNPLLAGLGEINFGRKKVQPPGRVVREFYQEAEPLLKYPLLEFGSVEFDQIATAFANQITAQRYTCYACAIMPDHVHLLIRKHKHKAEEMLQRLQDASRDHLRALGVGGPDHPIWTDGGWRRFLDHPDAIRRVIAYIRRNPLERGLPEQRWPFVLDYDGWPYHKS